MAGMAVPWHEIGVRASELLMGKINNGKTISVKPEVLDLEFVNMHMLKGVDK
jgi:hypothetical protein